MVRMIARIFRDHDRSTLTVWPAHAPQLWRMPVRDQTVGSFLELLSARVPAPGGGASAALHAAQSAALLGMVARYSDGPKYAADADTIASVLRIADELRDRALRRAESAPLPFGAVARAYQLPKDTDEARTWRRVPIAVPTGAAAGAPAAVDQVAD